MKLEVGMFVRTETGKIGKITNFDGNMARIDTDKFITYKSFNNELTKASYNIIDIIEVGDYVNGDKVIYTNDGYVEVGEENDNIGFTSDKFIKSIVTKEQFESMQYRVGSEE